MSGFNFRLQKILDIRYQKEEESKRHFKEAQDKKNRVQQKLNELKENYNKYSKVQTDGTMVERKIRQNYCNVLHFNIKETTVELDKKNKELELRREELKKSQIERKTVEILKDNQKQAYLKEQQLIEQKSNDEFALYGYIRNLKNK
ncbi:flagellar biosynthesis chaperone [Clostridium homopropionicum DSM 5847]|uniref:Flagellar FliJ protein n=1 Tax=Clostridium homopropionicum DSM 5847 TaxID=1121318 RepID=A0A0L6ZDI5_9CLOT|nr:flagellar export protein FliJ [Clostridium homopropionicum]KOA21012.1 flagellar biosynthesis chaperone [Clostridium homopropionicum DSM 5847]SFF99521.1 flagellar FliJ protein [Clostridium homopropionicum]